jgi:hypothetical protein
MNNKLLADKVSALIESSIHYGMRVLFIIVVIVNVSIIKRNLLL